MKEGPIRILQIANLHRDSGVAQFLMNYYRNIDKNKIQFDFAAYVTKKDNFIEEIRMLGGQVFLIPNYKRHPFLYKHTLTKIMKEHAYNAIHTHESILNLPILIIARACRIPVRIAHSHNTCMSAEWKNKIVRMLQTKFIKYATHLCACSQDAALFLFGEKCCQTLPVFIANNAVDLEKFQFDIDLRKAVRKKLGLEDKFIIGHVGRMTYQKNQEFLLDIFQQIYKRDKQAHLLLLGSGKEEQMLKDKIKDLHLNPCVTCMGVQKEMPSFFSAMDVFLLPSRFEGLPVTLIEAQASGLKCVVSDVVDKSANVSHCVVFFGLEKSVELWADAVIGCKGMDRQIDRDDFVEFDVHEQVKRLCQFYYNCLNAGKYVCRE